MKKMYIIFVICFFLFCSISITSYATTVHYENHAVIRFYTPESEDSKGNKELSENPDLNLPKTGSSESLSFWLGMLIIICISIKISTKYKKLIDK